MTFTNGVPRGEWARFIFDTEHRDAIQRQVAVERAAQGLPATTTIRVRV